MSNPMFKWFEIEIELHESVFKPGTDAILLGSWTSQLDIAPRRIIDAGTGSGILALMMARKFAEAHIEAIDIAHEAVMLAKQQFAHSMWKERLSARVGDILNIAGTIPAGDLCISNPPYFFDQMKSPEDIRARSKHGHETAAAWVNGLCNITHPYGWITIILPTEDTFEWIRAFNARGLYVRHRLNVYTTPSAQTPKRSLLAFHHELQTPITERICLADENQNPTAIYRTWFDREEK